MQKAFFTILLAIISCFTSAQTIDRLNDTLDVECLKEDLAYLRNVLQNKIPNAHLYVSRQRLGAVLDSLQQQLTGPMTVRQFYNLLSVINGVVKDGHLFILPPGASTIYIRQHFSLFPFAVFIDGEKLFITHNYSLDTTIRDGTEILGINGISTPVVLTKMLAATPRDGYNMNYPRWVLTNYFMSYYGFVFNFPEKYTLQLRSADSTTNTVVVQAVSQTQLNTFRSQRYPAGNTSFISYTVDSALAKISIRSWNTELVKKVSHRDIKKELKTFAKMAIKANSANMVIDLRSNQGGQGGNGAVLLRYLLHKPFKYFQVAQYIKKVSDTTQVLANLPHRLTKTYKPVKHTYKGNIYVLTNGGSFSNSAIFAAIIKNTGRGKIVGEETGGNGIILSGGGGKFVLPNSKISLFKAIYRFASGNMANNTGHGVVPDYEVAPTLKDRLDNTDPAMDYILKLIGK